MLAKKSYRNCFLWLRGNWNFCKTCRSLCNSSLRVRQQKAALCPFRNVFFFRRVYSVKTAKSHCSCCCWRCDDPNGRSSEQLRLCRMQKPNQEYHLRNTSTVASSRPKCSATASSSTQHCQIFREIFATHHGGQHTS